MLNKLQFYFIIQIYTHICMCVETHLHYGQVESKQCVAKFEIHVEIPIDNLEL